MLRVNHLTGFGSGGVSATTPTVAYQDLASSTSNLSTYTFSGMSLGEAAAGRYIVCTVTWLNSGATRSVSSVTVGGVTATISVQNASGGDDEYGIAIVIAAVPTRTTADVVVTMSGTCSRCSVTTHRVTGVDPTAHATATDLSHSSGVLDLNVNTPANGVCVALSYSYNSSPAGTTWVGLTEDVDTDVETADYHSAASLAPTVEATPLTITATCADTTPKRYVGASASWGP